MQSTQPGHSIRKHTPVQKLSWLNLRSGKTLLWKVSRFYFQRNISGVNSHSSIFEFRPMFNFTQLFEYTIKLS